MNLASPCLEGVERADDRLLPDLIVQNGVASQSVAAFSPAPLLLSLVGHPAQGASKGRNY